MPTLKSELTSEEQRNSDEFFARLPAVDSANISGLLTVVGDVAGQYLTSTEVDRIAVLLDSRGKSRCVCPFFATYIIGGQITKQGYRPDIDLLLATNMRYWSENEFPLAFSNQNEDVITNPSLIRERLLSPLLASIRGKFIPEVMGKIPNSYNSGNVKDKCLVRLKPTEHNSGRQIDFVYVNTGHTRFVNEQEFLDLDVDEDGMPLPRLPIQRIFLEDYVPQPLYL